MIYLELFVAFLEIGALSIGGGYVALPIIQNQVVTNHGWLTMLEFADIVTIAEMTPGPIALNAATFVGTKIGGLPGAIVATLGVISVPFVLVLLLAKLYSKFSKLEAFENFLLGLRPAVVGMIASAAISIVIIALTSHPVLGLDINFIGFIIMSIGLIWLKKFNMSPIIVILCSGLLGVLVYGFI